MKQYRKRPVVISAEQLPNNKSIVTLEGEMNYTEGAFEIEGVTGEHYACNGPIFHQTYDPVDHTLELPFELDGDFAPIFDAGAMVKIVDFINPFLFAHPYLQVVISVVVREIPGDWYQPKADKS